MYSLYRAWLSLGPCDAPLSLIPTQQPLNLTTPSNIPGAPDVTLQVGPSLTQFSAHKAVLSTHSGFFKAALLNQNGTSPIAVPNVNVDEFSSLLTFMYTGYLDLNLQNIYNILLATHILHMPKALEICRSFLLHSQNADVPQRSNTCGVIKPIASRKAAMPTQQIFPPNNTYSMLKKSEDTPFKVVSYEQSKASTSKVESTVETKKIMVEKKSKKKEVTMGEKFTIDIACCDGPVRFHRVLNKNYGLPINETQAVAVQEQNINRNAVLNKIMNENIHNKIEDEENTEIFTCLYCNHTFKSQYCFQKHARRHLNPVSLEAKTAPKEQTTVKREVKLLDMNVQYYPCKSCGSKFPSYYFVHKHRKMCHPEEMADNNNKNNEMVPESSAVEQEESSSSQIDVEAINNESN
ncbi:unnamed protein product [Brassicogethes aeneus]|uniref:Uncharacterized protein n=1 Tax=Brassicogethes aeneus TaxID=1431903 RepID=A0A9P0AT53_BRAAE|nr:unnamed protein product [Brassicogethes aeneus]